MHQIKSKLMQHMKMERMKTPLDCYQIAYRRCVLFLEDLVTVENIGELASVIMQLCSNTSFPESKTIIVMAKTKAPFSSSELVYSKLVRTLSENSLNIVVFFLINEDTNEMYYNDDLICVLCFGYRKYVIQMRDILKEIFLNKCVDSLDICPTDEIGQEDVITSLLPYCHIPEKQDLEDIKQKISTYLPMERMEAPQDIYQVSPERYILFYDDIVTRDTYKSIPQYVRRVCNLASDGKRKTIIVIAKTKDIFKIEEIGYYFIDFDITTINVFLLNTEEKRLYCYDKRRVFLAPLDFKFARKVRDILIGRATM